MSYYPGPVVGAVAGSAVSSAIDVATGKPMTISDVAINVSISAATAGLGGKAAKATVSAMSNQAKGRVGEILAAGKMATRGIVVTSRRIEIGLTGPGAKKTVADFIGRGVFGTSKGRNVPAESKYRTDAAAKTSLSPAQKKANVQIEDYTVIKSTSDDIDNFS